MVTKTQDKKTVEVIGTFYGERHVFQDGLPGRTIIGGFTTRQDNRSITIKGSVSKDDLKYGCVYRLDGFWSEHPKYGTQFHFSSFCQPEPQDRESIVDYLATCPGIGPMRAAKIYDLLGNDAIQQIKANPEVLQQIRGITSNIANDVQNSLLEREAVEQFTIELKKILDGRGFQKSLFRILKNDYGTAAVQVIKNNPYTLLKYRGTGFERVDQLFLELGNQPDDIRRQKHFIEWSIGKDMDGSTWIPKTTLHNALHNTLQDLTKFDEAVQCGIDDDLFVEQSDHLALPSEARAENYVAQWLHNAKTRPCLWPHELQTSGENKPSEHQWGEYKNAIAGPIALLIGSPGTGKTWLVARIIETLQNTDKTILVAAPTGKAALRITETLKEQGVTASATTIHSLLGAEVDDNGWRFRHNEINQLEASFIIIDESSMIDTKLLSSLLKAVSDTTNVLFVGDPDQLAPVGRGAPLRDMIDAGFPCGKLTEIRRNAGAIVHACAAIREQKRFDNHAKSIDCDDTNLVLVSMQPNVDSVFTAIKEIERHEKNANDKFSPLVDMQIIVAINKARNEYNKVLQDYYNPAKINTKESPTRKIRPMDKVICLTNGIAALATKSGEIKIANGDIGYVEDVEKARLLISVNNEFVYAPMYSDQWGENDWDMGYAISCHKSQGSQWPVVVVVLDPSFAARGVCDRHWIYTAISRAQRRCYLIGGESTIWDMIKKSNMSRRKTLLVEQVNEMRWSYLDDVYKQLCKENV